MTEPKFTPGPWTCLGPSFGDPLPRYTTEIETDWEYEGAENRQICEMPFHHHDEENEANAHLIAAAPELYEALEWAYNTAVEHDNQEQFDWAIYCERLYQALAKARGESHD